MKFILSLIVVICFSAIATQAQVAIIANKSVSESSIDASKAGSIYSLSTKKWSNGSAIVIYDMSAAGATKEKFYAFISKNDGALKKEWLKLKLTEGADVPKPVASDADMVKMVASTPGAIGYVSASAVTGDVKVLTTIK
jgi:ABC-type phosphate transport system substrate-binding protein